MNYCKASSTRAHSVCKQKQEKCMLTDWPLMPAVKPLKSFLTTTSKDSRHSLWLGMYAVARHTNYLSYKKPILYRKNN